MVEMYSTFERGEAKGYLQGTADERERSGKLVKILKELRNYPHCIKCCQDIDKALAEYEAGL